MVPCSQVRHAVRYRNQHLPDPITQSCEHHGHALAPGRWLGKALHDRCDVATERFEAT